MVIKQRRAMKRWVAATDGSCLGVRQGRAGWAWAVAKDPALFIAHWNSAGMGHATSHRAELMALVQLLEFLPPEQAVEIRMDSQSVIKVATTLRHQWRQNGWRRPSSDGIANVDLVKRVDRLLHGRDAKFTWVRAHQAREVGDPMNFFVDRAARAAARQQAQPANVSIRSSQDHHIPTPSTQEA